MKKILVFVFTLSLFSSNAFSSGPGAIYFCGSVVGVLGMGSGGVMIGYGIKENAFAGYGAPVCKNGTMLCLYPNTNYTLVNSSSECNSSLRCLPPGEEFESANLTYPEAPFLEASYARGLIGGGIVLIVIFGVVFFTSFGCHLWGDSTPDHPNTPIFNQPVSPALVKDLYSKTTGTFSSGH